MAVSSRPKSSKIFFRVAFGHEVAIQPRRMHQQSCHCQIELVSGNGLTTFRVGFVEQVFQGFQHGTDLGDKVIFGKSMFQSF